MEENKKEVLESVKKSVDSFSNKVTDVCDNQGEKMMSLLKKSVSAVDDCATNDPAKLSKTILLINIVATAIMLFSFYVLPAVPSLKGDGSMTLQETLKLFKSIANAGGGGGDMEGVGLTIFIGRLLFFFTFANIGLGLYTLSTEKSIPYLSNRLTSILTLIFMIIMFFKLLDGALVGIYIATLASLVVGLSGFVMISGKR